MYRVYMMPHYKKIYVADVPNWDLVQICVDKCEEEGNPYMVMIKDAKDTWVSTAAHMDKDFIRDAIGRVPFEYTDKFMRRGTDESEDE